MTNIIQPKSRTMIYLRSVLVGALILMGLMRSRVIIILLTIPKSYLSRDVIQEYLIAKAALSGVNPYLPLNELMQLFIGNYPYFPHSAPYPPIMVILSLPLAWLSIKGVIITWLIFEMACLLVLTSMLSMFWKGRVDWKWAIIIFLILLGWYPVKDSLYFGQLSILLTVLLLGALLALNNEHKVIAGILMGITFSIKLITWPLIIYFILKKDWRTFLSSCLTALALNMVALISLGVIPFVDFLHATKLVSNFWRLYWFNTSLWSIGSRIFLGIKSNVIFNTLEAPPLISIPSLATPIPVILIISILVIGLLLAISSKDTDTAFAILLCVIVIASPISWFHYYIIIIISILVIFQKLLKIAFPLWETLIFLGTALLIFLFNDQIENIVTLFNGGKMALQARGDLVTPVSSLLSWLPTLELIVLGALAWRIGMKQRIVDNI